MIRSSRFGRDRAHHCRLNSSMAGQERRGPRITLQDELVVCPDKMAVIMPALTRVVAIAEEVWDSE